MCSRSMSLTEEVRTAVSDYISACRQVSAGKLSVHDSEFASAAEAVDCAATCGSFHEQSGWTDEDRALCMQMLSEQARALPDRHQWIDMFFVTADAELFASATRMFGRQYDMLGAMLEYADGPEHMQTIVLLCAQLNIHPFRVQDVHEHVTAKMLAWSFGCDPEERRVAIAWKEAHCRDGIEDNGEDTGEDRPQDASTDAVGKEPTK